MKLINSEFTSIFKNNFLTENMAIVLYGMMKTIRPLKLLEFGYGYTTPFLLEAIKDIKEELTPYNEIVKTDTHDNYSGTKYNPELVVVDNLLDIDGEQFAKDFKNMEMLSLSNNMTLVKSDMKDYIQNCNEKYDLIWIDAGPKKDYIDYFKYINNMISDGGLIIIHSTLTNVEGKEFLRQFNDSNYEKLSLLEPHKKWQNSFTLLKRKTEYPTYTEIA